MGFGVVWPAWAVAVTSLVVGVAAPVAGQAGGTEDEPGTWLSEAERILAAFRVGGVDGATGLAYGYVDRATGAGFDQDGGAGVSTPVAHALYVATLEAFHAVDPSPTRSEEVRSARRAMRQFGPVDDEGGIVPRGPQGRLAGDDWTHGALLGWFGTPLASSGLLGSEPWLGAALARMWDDHAVPVAHGNGTLWTLDDEARDLQATWHQAGLVQVMLALHGLSGGAEWGERAMALAETPWAIRSPATNLSRNALFPDGSTDGFWDIIAMWPTLDAQVALLGATGDSAYLNRAQVFADAMIRHGFNETLRTFALGLEPDGTPRVADGLNGDTIPEYDETQVAQALLRLHVLTGEPRYRIVAEAVAERWGRSEILRRDTGYGVWWTTSAGRALTVHTLLDLYAVTGNRAWHGAAERVARDLRDNHTDDRGRIPYSQDRSRDQYWAETLYFASTAYLRLNDPRWISLSPRSPVAAGTVVFRHDAALAVEDNQWRVREDPACAMADSACRAGVRWFSRDRPAVDGATSRWSAWATHVEAVDDDVLRRPHLSFVASGPVELRAQGAPFLRVLRLDAVAGPVTVDLAFPLENARTVRWGGQARSGEGMFRLDTTVAETLVISVESPGDGCAGQRWLPACGVVSLLGALLIGALAAVFLPVFRSNRRG